jgi:transcription termination factor NusB
MTISTENKEFYEQTLAVTKKEIAELDNEIEAELAKVKDRLAELQTAKKATLQMYGATCARLGVPNDLAEDEEGDQE